MNRPARLAVLISGSGTNLQAILDAIAAGSLAAEVAVVVSNNPEAYGIERARRAGVPVVVKPFVLSDHPADERRHRRLDYDAELAYEVRLAGADLVVLAGWDRLLSSNFVGRCTVINLHPARPGAFPGLDAIKRAYGAWTRGEIDRGGVMVHYVPDEGMDDGPVIASEDVPFEPDDTLETFEARVHSVEHRLLVTAIERVMAEGVEAR